MFGNKFKLENIDPQTLDVWAVALFDLKVTEQEVALATRISLTQEWPPSGAKAFINLARQYTDEYPDVNKAFRVACNNAGAVGNDQLDWLDVTVRETARRFGLFDLARADEKDLNRFKSIYEEVKAEHRNGAEFTIPKSHRIEFDQEPVAGPEVVEQYIAKIKEKLKGVSNG